MNEALQPHLDTVRRRVRCALAGELAGRLLAGAAAVFWCGMLADYLLEPPPQVRMIAWWGVAVAAVVWLGHRCVAPLLRPLPDRVVASWIERHRPELQESLTTAIENPRGHLGEETSLVDEARSRAVAALADHGVASVVQFDRPRRWFTAAAIGVVTVVGFAAAESSTFAFFLQRLALSPEPWPRRVQLTLEDFQREEDGRLVRRVAIGAGVDLTARAELTGGHIAPPNVELRSRSDNDEISDHVFSAVGQPTTGDDAHQAYRLTLERVDKHATLTLRGGDARLGPLHLIGEHRPQVVDVELSVTEPTYLGGATWRVVLGAVDAVPEGARVILHCRASKPLSRVEAVWRPQASDEATPLTGSLTDDGESFTIDCPPAGEDAVVTLMLTDRYGIAAAEPHPVTLPVTRDRLPRVALAARGVGPTVTPSARLPLEATIEDDHNAVEARLEVILNDADKVAVPIGPADLGRRFQSKTAIDLLTFTATRGGEPPAPGQRLSIVAMAADRHDLGGVSRTSASQKIDVAIVTPDALLARLEQREINLRQTFEATIESVRRVTIALDKLRSTGDAKPSEDDPTETPAEVTKEEDEPSVDKRALRRMRVADDLSKATQETLSAADAFEQIYLELENNRIPNDDLKHRIRTLIAAPLREIGQQTLPAAQAAAAESDETGYSATKKAIRVMEAVLDKMESLETYNEVVAMLRQIIDEQQSLNDATKRSRKSGLRRLLLD